MIEYLNKDEQLNIVFRKDTPYVSKEDVSITGQVIPYKLETAASYNMEDGVLHVKFRPSYHDGRKEFITRYGHFPMRAISKVFVSKLPKVG